MLNNRFIKHPLTMRPDGSLNHLPVSSALLHPKDPLKKQHKLTGYCLASRQALIQLLTHLNHPSAHSLRNFISQFDPSQADDDAAITLFAQRFSAILKTARSGDAWQEGSTFQRKLAKFWQSIETVALSGGLTSNLFGVELAERVEALCPDIAIISSPWGGLTALYGLAQTVAQKESLLVMDFGATGIKSGIATNYGNHLELLPDISVQPLKIKGLIRKESLFSVFKQTRQLLPKPLPVAVSLACYMKEGQPFDYHSGIYHRLCADSHNLANDLHEYWLPECGLSGLALLEHDSTAAALAFRLKQPAMMVTLGTGLGSAPCPLASSG